MAKAKTPAAAKAPVAAPDSKAGTLLLTQGPNDDPAMVLAEAIMGPNIRHGHLAASYAGRMIADTGETLGLMDCAKIVEQRAKDAVSGDLGFVSAMMASQAMSTDTMFTEFARRAAINMAQYPEAAERYARLALKAQSNSRATLEALAKLHQPREQTVRHVHVNQGGQAIVADQFHHHHGRGMENAETVNQSHATGTAGESAAMPCPDAGRDGVPVASGERAQAVPDARRAKPWRA